MLTEPSEATLLEKAKAEEKAYNWADAAKLYGQIATSYLDKNLPEKAAEIFKKIGYAYYKAAYTVETSEEYLKQCKTAIDAYKEAADLFRQIGNNAEELECEAEALFVNGDIAGSIAGIKEALSKSNELFIKSNEFYSKRNHQESCARTLSRAATASHYLSYYCSERGEILKVGQKGREISEKAWEISKEIGNIKYLIESITAESCIWINESNIVSDQFYEQRKEHSNKLLQKIEKSLVFVEGYNDFQGLSMIYTTAGYCYTGFGLFFIKNDAEQKELLDKGLRLLEKGLEFARKTKDKSMIILSIYHLYRSAIFGERIEYIQKRIFSDLNEVEKLCKIFLGSKNIWNLFPKYILSLYYAILSLSGLFTPAQRTSYAKKGITHAIGLLEIGSSLPAFAITYWCVTSLHSVLTLLATTKDEQDENAKNMLQYAKQAENNFKGFDEGIVIQTVYACIYVAYKTLADIAKSNKEKIKMLTIAADVYEKNIKHAWWGRSGNIGALIRLGRLYEELGILTKERSTINKARELYISLIKETHERGYPAYKAVIYEHIARIEDRLGNHTVSAESYEKAREAYAESLKIIEYKPLKNNVKEKIEYMDAWNRIEIAKTYHKSENHIEAKENYEKASKILENVTRYKYEAPYYAAWALLEEAEQASKQEMQDKAIEKYEITSKDFVEAIKTLQKAFKQSKDKRERERIEKLEKVANIRINYCKARIDLEKARILGRQGQHLLAAGKFASAASQFRNICALFKIDRERKELEAIYYLCRAWESMVLAEKYEEPERFAEAANLFTKASNIFIETKLKLLASGNSSFCRALEYGCKFDESIETEIKAQLYPKIKKMLRKAATSYNKGGFKSGADWALATSTYFDATWYLIKTDEELDLDKKGEHLGIGAGYLKSAAELFSKAGYNDKENEIQNRLNTIEKEEKILVSALNTIKKPAISSSTVGILAPACPLETSQSPRLSRVRQFTKEERQVAQDKALKRKFEIVYRDIFKEYPRVQKRECRVAIAQIGISTSGDIINEFYEMKASGLLSLRNDKIESVRAKITNIIKKAHESEVNILLFPEMTIDLNYTKLLEDISDLAKLYEMYIIPGSYHDQETKRNISVVFGPDGILWEQEKHIPAIIHIGTKRFKEGIEVGSLPQKTIVCNTEYGRIAIAICRDFLDMDLRVELKNFEPPVDLILNPAFTPVTADFKAAHFDARRSIYAYCFFANVGEFGDSLIYTPEKERIERTIPPKEEGLIYKDVDLFKLRSERKKWEKESNKERKFIQSTR